MEEGKIGRGQRLTMCLGALAAVAVCFTIAYPVAFDKGQAVTAPPRSVATTAGTDRPDALERFRVDREKVRAVEIEQLRRVADDGAAGADVRDDAREQLIELTQYMEEEVTLEGVLRARGFEDVLATVHGDSVNVLVRADAITRAQSAMILELAMRETDQRGGNIKIIPVA